MDIKMGPVFVTFLKKELLCNMLNLRYGVIFFLFVLLIVSATIVRTHLYKAAEGDYREARTEQLAVQEKIQSVADIQDFGLTVAKKPNPVAIFCAGLEDEMIRPFTFTRWSVYPETGARKFSAPLFQYFLQIDMILVINIVCSLLALMLMYDSICGEAENATLRLMLSGPLPRDIVILAKITSGWITIMIPLLLSLLIAIEYVFLVGKVGFTSEEIGRLLWIVFISVLYITFFFALGIAISASVRRSATALVWSLFVWILLTLALPNLVPLVVKQAAPIPPESKINIEKQAAREYVENVLALQWSIEMKESGDYSDNDSREQALRQRIAEETGLRQQKLEQFYTGKIQNQIELVQELSRISPSAGYMFAATHIAGTGVQDFLQLTRSVREFQDAVNDRIGRLFSRQQGRSGRNRRNQTIPDSDRPELRALVDFTVKPVDMGRAISYALTDIIILICLTTMLLLLGIMNFLRYDPQ